MAEKFSRLLVWGDEPSTGPMHMAADEAVMRLAGTPTLRWYQWERAEISFGYPMRWRDVESAVHTQPAVRRWTGGGMVEHGKDLTLALAIPGHHFPEPPLTIYERIHRAIADALGPGSTGLATPQDCSIGPACFANPARFDVLLDARKVAGGAIRRCRQGTLYQGSVQNVEIPRDFIDRLARNLAVEAGEWSPPPAVRALTLDLCSTRYGTPEWLKKR